MKEKEIRKPEFVLYNQAVLCCPLLTHLQSQVLLAWSSKFDVW